MADKNLRYFMRPEAKEEKIVKVPGPSTIKGEDGKPITMEVRVLHNRRIREINDSYRTRRMAQGPRLKTRYGRPWSSWDCFWDLLRRSSCR